MQSLRPYLWLKKTDNQYRAFFTISIPDGFRGNGLGSAVDNASSGVRTYTYEVEESVSAEKTVIDSDGGLHAQPSGISSVEIIVVDASDKELGKAKGNYQDADEIS